ncbi:MAG: membrane protein insertion efficiency factor YidD [Deltaproteobacteria bacterium]|nr:membrane protein insertion efficiency factor YidD [Deltaproteobacteria bacterium]
MLCGIRFCLYFALTTIIKVYRLLISPILGNRCRFYPSCSEYFTEAVLRYGFIKGALKGIIRLLKCNKFCKGGYDPVIK